ncbi:MAG: F-type H+-transporting ATPase subunit delta [Eubacteriales bacterium]|nr:F-type H+-transporting ATPase subunit delta [Eubacteriales bacterium]
MIGNVVARRYAQAFFELAQEKNRLDEIHGELNQVWQIFKDNPEFFQFYVHPLNLPQNKKDLIEKAFAGKVSSETLNFLRLLVDKRREKFLPEIVEVFNELTNEAKNKVEAELVAATELRPDVVEEIRKRLAEATGKTVVLRTQVDPALIGGVKVKIGDKVIDGSIATRLQKLKATILQNNAKGIGVKS